MCVKHNKNISICLCDTKKMFINSIISIKFQNHDFFGHPLSQSKSIHGTLLLIRLAKLLDSNLRTDEFTLNLKFLNSLQ